MSWLTDDFKFFLVSRQVYKSCKKKEEARDGTLLTPGLDNTRLFIWKHLAERILFDHLKDVLESREMS